MNTHRSLEALRRANPRTAPDFGSSIEAVRARIAMPADLAVSDAPGSRRRRGAVAIAGVSLAGALVAIALVGIGSAVHGPGVGVESAAAAVRTTVTRTADSADRSGTANVRITHEGAPWAAMSVSWNGDDLSLTETPPGRAGSQLRVVGGVAYAPDPDGRWWLQLGSADSIDHGSGGTAAQYLAAVRQDVGGTTLQRLTGGITGVTTHKLDDGSTVYTGSVAAGSIARETSAEDAQVIRLLPFGYAAQDEAADPNALLGVTITVAPDGIVRAVSVGWGSWLFTVDYSGLGATPAPVAPGAAHGSKQPGG